MSVVSYEVRDGKATYEGRSLAAWVPEVVRVLVERFRPARVVLFGSVARGDDGRDSDIDLLVVLPELQVRHHDAAVAMLRALRAVPVPVDIVVTDLAELQQRVTTPGSVRVAWREGVPVHEWPRRRGGDAVQALAALGSGGPLRRSPQRR